jgi:filamentous hemagglutinin
VHNACGDVYGPGDRGPLPDKVARTFTGATYKETVTTRTTTLYRVYGGTAEKFGGYWSLTLPTSSAEAISDSALDPFWGNTAERWVSIDVPPDTTLYEGTAERQGSLPGGGSQVIIEVGPNPAWESGGGSLP